MDRPLFYSDETLRSRDVLFGLKGSFIGLGHAALAAFGPGPCVSGLQIGASGPPSLVVTIDIGSIYVKAQTDATAYSTLGTDTTFIDKQGLLPTSTSLTITPPVTSGQSQWYLVQAIYGDEDTAPVVLPYWNSSDPDMPLSGPANSGSSQNTQRLGLCNIALKAGTPAATGSQVPPAPDAGYVGLWLILVANGQTTITSANWREYPFAPFIPNLMSLGNYFQRLVPATTFYVNGATGNDGNDGSQVFPFQTVPGAINAIAPFFSSQTQVTINIANGTYAPFTVPASLISGWNFVGNTGSPSSVTIANAGGNAVNVFNGTATFQGMTFTSLDFNINASEAQVNVTLCNLTGSANTPSIGSFNNSVVSLYGAIGYSGNGTAIAIAEAGGQINVATTTAAVTITLTGTPSFSQASFAAFYGNITFNTTPGVTFSGSATGPHYTAQINGVINTGGAGAGFLPGSTSGSTATGGQYI